MRRFSIYILLIALVSINQQAFCLDTEQDDSLKILFIGNSYTYVNNLPDVFYVLLPDSIKQNAIIEMYTKPGTTLHQHWEKGEALNKIKSNNWDYVVLQEQSTLGFEAINTVPSIREPDFFYKYAGLFIQEIERINAKPLLFLTWGRKNYADQQRDLNKAYINLSERLNVKLIPVGIVWQEVKTNHTNIELYLDDGSHPSPEGTYLVALVFYHSLFGDFSSDLPYEIYGQNFDWNTGKTMKNEKVKLININESTAEILQTCVSRKIKEFNSNSKEQILELYTSRSENVLVTAEDINKITGKWQGHLKLCGMYSEMNLTINNLNKNTTIECSLKSAYYENVIDQLVVYDASITNNEIIFYGKKHDEESIIRFNGIIEKNQIIGISEYLFPETTSNHCLGLWYLSLN